ncbi:phenylacetaldoxime dehydratase family protein [Acinetobacter sp. B10A]|uniref:phenylacetaldoxime dehydratase family protein n=1 Tax=Acinetobacter baretiae TaxID=2605383 RepID=UPI001B3C6AF0|nr:phenylacetaldoxime dehydratase family protein [Acinetobacter baretiae]MBF7684290.1 phenylacetaldoxime dehydratase family protein [Acinetobacter baretiae]
MESAIPKHLEQKRTCPRNLVDSQYLPPFPAWTTRFETNAKQFTIAYFSIQSKMAIDYCEHQLFTQYFQGSHQPQYWVPSTYVDAQHYHHLVITAYWSNVASFDMWSIGSGFQAWWTSPQREAEKYGYFLEIYFPKITEFETIFSDQKTPEGIAHLAQGMSDEMQEHAYYGSMRDRLPIAQTTPLDGEKGNFASIDTPHQSLRIKLKGKENLSLIRSGQDWENTTGKERTLYVNDVEPILRQGMDFLANHGLAEGCFNCRYMTVLDAHTGNKLNKTFGLAYFRDLKHLEQWAKSHPTHVKIFGSFMKYVQEMNFQINLKLFHEVMSIPAQSQHFEYIRCHENTGLLNTNPVINIQE